MERRTISPATYGSRGRAPPVITEYHRPVTLEDALSLIGDPDAVPLGGGTTVSARRDGSPIRVVDLQALPLDGIDVDGGTVRIGATTRIQDVVDADALSPVLREAARREGPRTIRNAATIGGTVVVADPESELLACLLVLDAVVTVARDGGSSDLPLEDAIEHAGRLAGGVITAVAFPAGGRLAADRTGRTPMDRPIVAAVAAVPRGEPDTVRVAVCGVAPHPLLVDPTAIADLEPPEDFRGAADYRRSLASVLVDRVLADLGVDR